MFSTIITSADISAQLSPVLLPAWAWLCLSTLTILEAVENEKKRNKKKKPSSLRLNRSNLDKQQQRPTAQTTQHPTPRRAS